MQVLRAQLLFVAEPTFATLNAPRETSISPNLAQGYASKYLVWHSKMDDK